MPADDGPGSVLKADSKYGGTNFLEWYQFILETSDSSFEFKSRPTNIMNTTFEK